jgi:GntR family transcriptional repressor for pyruvate dehydrogenase complex
LKPVSRHRLYEDVTAQITEWIETNGMQPGDRLPPEREIAVALGVSRVTVSQALVALEVLGIVEVRHGAGTILQQRSVRSRVVTALRNHVQRLPEIIEARDAMEVKLAALAAERRTDEDLEALAGALDVMRRDIESGGRGVEGDQLFHAAVTRSAYSGLLARLMDEIGDLIVETRIESLAQAGRPRVSLAGHIAIAEAIRDRKPDVAAAAMHAHIELVSDVAWLRS